MRVYEYKGYEAIKVGFRGSYSIYKDGQFKAWGFANHEAVRAWIDGNN